MPKPTYCPECGRLLMQDEEILCDPCWDYFVEAIASCKGSACEDNSNSPTGRRIVAFADELILALHSTTKGA